MRNKQRLFALAIGSVAVVGVGVGAVEASPTTATAHGTTGHYSACLTASNTLVNVTVSPQKPIACPSDTQRVTWNAVGHRGPRGHQGPRGVAGAKGAQGVPGKDGSTVLNGTGAPTATLGKAGDFYIDTKSWTIYGPKTADGWPATGQSLQGPAGASGASAPVVGTQVMGHLDNTADGFDYACGTPTGFSAAFDCGEEPVDGSDPAAVVVPVDSVLSHLMVSIAPQETDTALAVFDEEALFASDGPDSPYVVMCTIPAGDTSCTADTDGYAVGGDHLRVFAGPVFVNGDNPAGPLPAASYGYTMTPGNVPAPPVRQVAPLKLSPQLHTSHRWFR